MKQSQVKTHCIEPGSLWQNGHVESFNDSLRDECLYRELMFSVTEARILFEEYRHHYNDRGSTVALCRLNMLFHPISSNREEPGSKAIPFFLAPSVGTDIVATVFMTVEVLNFRRRPSRAPQSAFGICGCAHSALTVESDRVNFDSNFQSSLQVIENK